MPFEVKYAISGLIQIIQNEERTLLYQGPVVERLSGEQLWDSLVALNYPVDGELTQSVVDSINIKDISR